jgi:hypothetical protein
MPQVTSGATLLRVDDRFPEVHELPRKLPLNRLQYLLGGIRSRTSR